MGHAVAMIAEEMGTVLERGALSPNIRERRDASSALFDAAGADVLHEEIESGASSVPAGRAALARLLAKQPNIEAVYFSNDDMAIGGAHHCLAHGISTPDDLALFGFNGLDIGQTMAKPLSTLLTYRYEIGVLAGRAILTRLNNEKIDLRTDVGFKLIEGATA